MSAHKHATGTPPLSRHNTASPVIIDDDPQPAVEDGAQVARADGLGVFDLDQHQAEFSFEKNQMYSALGGQRGRRRGYTRDTRGEGFGRCINTL